jgi:hypothetical protein
MSPKSYESEMIDELCAITSIQDAHTICYFCNPTRGYVLIYQDQDGYHLVENWQGFTKSGGPWDRDYTFEGFLDEVKLLGGVS